MSKIKQIINDIEEESDIFRDAYDEWEYDKLKKKFDEKVMGK